MDEKLKSQILEIRDTGLTNMLDINAVQKLAHDMGFHELVVFIEYNKNIYFNFITEGK
ncbi:MAG: DUF5049 domain-containing protein [Clostridiales bacterium]|nr:MAG: DUF5049 domain-containing protein [Clostridiales bacterium]